MCEERGYSDVGLKRIISITLIFNSFFDYTGYWINLYK